MRAWSDPSLLPRSDKVRFPERVSASATNPTLHLFIRLGAVPLGNDSDHSELPYSRIGFCRECPGLTVAERYRCIPARHWS